MKKVAIVGFAPSTKDMAPKDMELWGLNDLDLTGNITRWFDIHPIEQLRNMPSRNGEESYIQRLANRTCPVYMQQKVDDVPNSVAYPLERIIKKFGNYFTNSISYMLALAIDEGYEEIHIYGVDMAQGTEYAHQRPSCEYFIGLARGMGINVVVPKQSDLLKTAYLYGFEAPAHDEMKRKYKERLNELNKRLQYIESEEIKALTQSGFSQLVREKYFLLGALEDTEFYLRQW